ncbi:unnamed protein product [Trichogramma brassicae]|uniref:RNA-directed DNA polymerase n=2 Tax=Trichogramma brassicae TaxID=86971 RepID=A0A6H5IL95_9HYME|nr:unnamed protein product [Trichogramma brassicae]
MATVGTRATVSGETQIQVKLGELSIDTDALTIPGLNQPVVLGMDFLRKEKAVIDLYRHVVHLGKDKRVTVAILNHDADQVDTAELPTTGFPDEYQKEAQELLRRFRHVISTSGLGADTCSTKHVINVKNPRPFRQAPYRYNEEKRVEIESSPIVMAKKKGGAYRFCVDYRKLNDLTEDTAQEIPRITDALRDLGEAKVFTTLDLKSGYWQIPMDADSKKYTAFTTPTGGAFQFRFMPFGVKGGPGTFQKLMSQEVLAGYLNEFCIVYLDDIVVYSRSWEEHFVKFGPGGVLSARAHERMPAAARRAVLYSAARTARDGGSSGGSGEPLLESRPRSGADPSEAEKRRRSAELGVTYMLERLSVHRLRCSTEKLHIGQRSIEYLGFIVDPDGNEVKPSYLSSIQEAPAPRTKKELQAFIGACNWLREYVADLATLLAPLTDLLRAKGTFRWPPAAQEAFLEIKNAFKAPLRLARPLPQERYVLQTDASARGMGAVLYQQPNPPERRIIAYASAKFTATEAAYHCNEQECLAIVWAVKKFRPYLEDRPFTLRTDSHTVTWLQRFKNTRDKLTRWALLLQEFQFSIEHCAGRENELPDLLSRNPQEQTPEGLGDTDRLLPPVRRAPQIGLLAAEAHPVVKEIQEAQKKETTNGPAEDYRDWRRENGLIWVRLRQQNKWRIYVLDSARKKVLQAHHDDVMAGHPEMSETLRAVQRYYHWNNVQKDVRKYVGQCETCQTAKKAKTISAPTSSHTPQQPWEMVALDYMGPYPTTDTGNRYVLPMPGLPSRYWRERCSLVGDSRRRFSPTTERNLLAIVGQRPARNGKLIDGQQRYITRERTPTERRNQEIKTALRIQLQNETHERWDKQLPIILFQLRNRQNGALKETPAHTLLGRSLLAPGEWRMPPPVSDEKEEAWKELRQRQERYQQTYAKEQGSPDTNLTVGQRVYMRVNLFSKASKRYCSSLSLQWEGPFEIRQMVTPGIYLINKGKGVKVHVSRLRTVAAMKELEEEGDEAAGKKKKKKKKKKKNNK